MRLFSFIRDLSETISNGMSITAQKSKQFDNEITARVIESELDCKRRAKKAVEAMHEEGLTDFNIQEAYDEVMKGKREVAPDKCNCKD